MWRTPPKCKTYWVINVLKNVLLSIFQENSEKAIGLWGKYFYYQILVSWSIEIYWFKTNCHLVTRTERLIDQQIWQIYLLTITWKKLQFQLHKHLPEILARFLEDSYSLQKQPSGGVIIKMCSENMHQLQENTHAKVHFQYSSWVFSCKFAAYF